MVSFITKMDRKLAHERKIAKLESRRATKPIVEKRRRARINQYLVELKRLICQATNRDLSRSSKLEKADILEMTVGFLQNMQQRQLLTGISADPRGMGKFTGGFVECASEVQRYLQATDCVEPNLRQRLVEHMQQCAVSLGTTTIAAAAAAAANSNSLTAPLRAESADHHGSLPLNVPQQQQNSLLPPSSNNNDVPFSNQFSIPPHFLNHHQHQNVDMTNAIPPHLQHIALHSSNQQQQQDLINSVLAAGAQFNGNSSNALPPHLVAATSLLSPAAMSAFNVHRYYASLQNAANGNDGNGGGAAPVHAHEGERDNASATPNFSSHSPSSSSTSSSLRSSSEASSHTSETEMSMMRPTSSCRSSPPATTRLDLLSQHRPQLQQLQSNSDRPSASGTNCSNASVWRPW